jgi:hypothetical protein
MHKPYRWGDKAPPTVQRLRELRMKREAAVQAKRDHQRFVIRHRLMHGSEEERDRILRDLHGDAFGEFAIDFNALSLHHASDCAVHNEPAMPAGPCNCGAQAHVEGRRVRGMAQAVWMGLRRARNCLRHALSRALQRRLGSDR